MALLAAYNVSKSFGERTLFSAVNFELPAKCRVGLVGANGTGKTTLFRILAKQSQPDSGHVSLEKNARIGYMEQHAEFQPENTVYEETLRMFSSLMKDEKELEALNREIESQTGELEQLVHRQSALVERYQQNGGLTYRARTRSMLLGMGFRESDLSLPMKALSGGQQSKVQMCKLLLSGADLLLLDEPTNHLDIQSVEWLENFLSAYPGGLLVVSHDRYFLDKICTSILSLEHGSVKRYTGNYSQFSQKRAQQLMEEERHYKNAQREIQRMENMITQLRRWNREKSIRTAESKEKQLEKLKQSVQAPAASAATLGFSLKVAQNSGQDVLMAEHLSKAYNKPLFSDVNLHIRKGERVFLLGPNGCGKTTLFRILMKRVRPDNGLVQYGANVRPGYYDQTQSGLNPQSTALQEIQNAYPQMNDTQARSALASFLFRGDDVFKPISALSGGEKARIELLKLMLSESNFLLLDEPTNHLDAESREALETALDGYEGTLFAITHDRYLANRLATRILVFTPEGLKESIGNYDDYLRNAEQWALASSPAKEEEKPAVVSQSKQQRESSVQLRRLRAQLRKCEDEISALEQDIDEKEALLSQPEIATDYQKMMEITSAIDRAKQQLEQAMERWEDLSLQVGD